MKKVAKKFILIMLMLLVIFSSLSITTFAVEKKDEKGEILNLPPFVDFEVKEKRKVDVIVDVGNTSYTTEQINSMVNEQLRPKLQENGVDYKIHIEKSSEGTTRQYYFSGLPGTTWGNKGLWYYDIVTKEHVFVKDIGLDNIRNAYIDPDTGLIFMSTIDPWGSYSLIKVSYTGVNDKVPNYPFTSVTTYFNSNQNIDFSITSDGYALADYGGGYGNGITAYPIKLLTNGTYGVAKAVVDSENIISSVTNEYRMVAGLNDSMIWTGIHYSNKPASVYYVKDYLPFHKIQFNNWNQKATLLKRNIMTYSDVGIFKSTGDIMYVSASVDAYDRVSAPSTVIYHPITNTYTEFEIVNNNQYPTQPRFYVMDDNRLIYIGINDGQPYIYEDYRDTSTKKLLKGLEGTSTYVGTSMPSSHISSYIFFHNNFLVDWQTRYASKVMNVDTGEVLQFAWDRTVNFIQYPKWYTSKQRKITDIIEEVPYRTDAEKYYVRIDDLSIPHLDRESTLGNTITILSKNQINYMSIGNSNNEAVTNKIQSALGTTQRYSISEIQTAFNKVGSYITDRKEVDLHILMGKPGVTEATIKLTIKSMTTNLLKDNIIVTPHYVKGTDNSTLYELLNQVNWRDDRNNYVLFLHQSMMTEFSDPLVEEEISLLLKGNYAFFTAMGSTSNKSANESLIASNNGNGYFFAGTNISHMSTRLQEYMIQTAVKNPKRVSDTLVLNYDSTTGDYSSDVLINTYYEDFESDRKINERFRTTHDPSVYENNTGVMEGIGKYQESPTTKFTKVGLYEMVVQVQDDPTANANFSNYNLWSQDSLSRLVLYVHRAPVAEFSAIVNASRMLTLTDYSYDLDRYSQRNKGVTTWVWKWKKVDDAEWTVGKPSSQILANTDYFVSLKVKDIDGAWSSEVVKYVTTKPYNQPPVALFTIDPKSVSWNKQAIITDRSYDPDGDSITSREWKVYRDYQVILSSGTTPTLNQIKAAAVSAGFNALGNYKLSLRVKDSEYWSETYTDYVEIINFPPIAEFEPLADTFRDSVNKVVNTTVNPDQDGDNVAYQWMLSYRGKTYSLGTAQHPSFKVKVLGLGKLAVGTWQLELKASDPLGASSYMTRSFNVLNQTPTTTITSGRSTGYINEPYAYTSSRSDADTEDVASLQSFWRLTSPSGKVKEWYTQNISITYVEKGSYVLENWVVDQLDAKSEVQNIAITILNQAPIPGFTTNPSITYRGESIKFVSTATDMDGYIDKHKYEYVTDEGTIFTLSASTDFEKSFSTIGDLNIRQTVTDNDGATAVTTKKVMIVNRPPVVKVTTPSGTTPSTATTFTSLTPTIYWKMTDEDNDQQEKYEVVLKSAIGTVLQTSKVTTGSGQSFVIPSNWNLLENTIYRVTVRSFDGYDWSQYASDKYFNIITNQLPEAGFTWSPSAIWEGDAIQIKHQVKDSDEDTLLVQYKVTAPDGTVTVYPNSNTSYSLTKAKYYSDAFVINPALVGRYVIEQTVSDGKSDVVTLTQRLNVNELDVIGEVVHTDQWEQYRLRFNQSATENGQSLWHSNQFYAGEKFILKAKTTNTGVMDSSSNLNGNTYAKEVKVSLLNKYDTTLLRQNVTNWIGELWHTEFTNMKKGKYDVIFEATYSNGIVKQYAVTLEIIGKASSFVSLHRWK
ncbi:MAG: fibronectin type III domain-containing protein [Candidatus Pristimantibacillus lignocellulolyticus]|uniref:Fibronectin type III domain-containing protein n=1 Tax=Candidatus Pristimantibacillus lignocellulolyticus TaxID=2994561 RepID=A0A9J6ZGN6_9BACL|nr:MAG: fibronectin type III domain-containing protein [Candidatus Pristimantibacillus lignocellulolyticus]